MTFDRSEISVKEKFVIAFIQIKKVIVMFQSTFFSIA